MRYRARVADDRLERILALLRERGGRATTPRRLIIRQLLAAADHVTAEELATRVQAEHPDVHLSTVYRCLEDLEGAGVVEHVHLGHGPAVYHLVEDETHRHLVCDSCGRVEEIASAVFDDLARRLRGEFGFELDPGHFAVGGRCRDCAAKQD